MIKKVIAISLVLSLLFIFSSLTAAEELSGKIIYATNRTDIADDKLREWADMFEAKYPGVEVEIEGLKDYERIKKTRIAAGEAPDVFLITPVYFPISDYPNYFAPLDNLGYSGEIYFEDNYTVNGHLYALPYGVMKAGFVYNKKAFKKAGITEIPSTLEDFYNICQKLVDAGIIPISSLAKDTWATARFSQYLPPFYKGSGDIYDPMLDMEKPFTLDTT